MTRYVRGRRSSLFTSRLAAAMAGLALASASALWAQDAAAETKGYVVNWFYMGNYDGGAADCPNGLNQSAFEFYRREFFRLGYNAQQVDELMKDFPGEYGPQPWAKVAQVRGNGKDDVYANPTTAPDPGLKEVQGRHAYGFDLDGKAANAPAAFVEPDTHEQGIDNQLYRALGCIRTLRAGIGENGTKGRPSYPEYIWEVLRNAMPAWLISIESDGGKDGAATVIIDRALETVTRDSSGANVRADMTYRVDPDVRRRANATFRGKIKEGVFTSDEPVEMHLIGNAFGLAPDMHFKKARLRLALNPDGSLRGVLGGYLPWYTIYWGIASRGTGTEYNQSTDAVAIYYALRRLADGDPDPQTQENRAISSAYMIEAVPAYVVAPAEISQASRQ